jgi:uncharacterized protein
MLVVSNTSPISNLSIIGQLGLLRAQFGSVWIPSAVAEELGNIANHAAQADIEEAKRKWLRTQSVRDSGTVHLLTRELHRGEAEAISPKLETSVLQSAGEI